MYIIIDFCVTVYVILVFVVAGLVNLFQAICYLLVRPLSKRLFRRVNSIVAPFFGLVLLFFLEVWAGIKVELYTDSETTYDLLGKESAIVISNHKFVIDWLLHWIIAERKGCLGRAVGVARSEAASVPFVGWLLYFSEFIFVHRTWDMDEENMKTRFRNMKEFDHPFWMTIFVEGTRFSPVKLRGAQEFAASKGMHVPKNVLIPRTKGFCCAVNHMRSYVPAVYDATIIVPKDHEDPSTLGIITRKPSLIKLYMKRYSMKDLPESEDGVAQWCKDRFVAKDALMDKFYKDGKLEGQQHGDSRPSKKAIAVFAAWFCLVSLAIVKLHQTFPQLSSWKALVIVSSSIVAFVMLILYWFVDFSRFPTSLSNSTTKTRHRRPFISN